MCLRLRECVEDVIAERIVELVKWRLLLFKIKCDYLVRESVVSRQWRVKPLRWEGGTKKMRMRMWNNNNSRLQGRGRKEDKCRVAVSVGTMGAEQKERKENRKQEKEVWSCEKKTEKEATNNANHSNNSKTCLECSPLRRHRQPLPQLPLRLHPNDITY